MASICSAERTGRVLFCAGRVADPGGVVADDEHGLVAEVLELAHLPQHDGVAQVDVRGGGVQAELHAKLLAHAGRVSQPLLQLLLRVHRLAPTGQVHRLLLHAGGYLLVSHKAREFTGGGGILKRGTGGPWDRRTVVRKETLAKFGAERRFIFGMVSALMAPCSGLVGSVQLCRNLRLGTIRSRDNEIPHGEGERVGP